MMMAAKYTGKFLQSYSDVISVWCICCSLFCRKLMGRRRH